MTPPDVILLSIDALRADHLHYLGYDRSTSPTLDALAENLVSFSNAMSASSHTREAVPSLLTGRSPDVFAADGYRLATESIAGMVHENGYATAGFHSNPYLSRAYGYDSEFDTFYDDLYLGNNRLLALVQRALDKFVFNRGEYHARADEINRRSLSWLDSLSDTDRPFFLWNHYMDVHGPYNPPESHEVYVSESLSNGEAQKLYQKTISDPESVTERERELLIDLYDSELRYLDDRIGAFLDELRERDLFEDSLIVVTADHGDAFGERGYFTHPRYPHEELLRVPLLISTPSGDTGTIEQPVSTLDIVPTIGAWAGVDTDSLPGDVLVGPEDGPRTDSLRGLAFSSAQGEDDHSNVRRFAVRDDEWLCQMNRETDSGDVVSRRVFDVRKASAEEIPLDEAPDRVTDLFDRLTDESSTKLTAARPSANDDDVPDDVSDRLDALGYK